MVRFAAAALALAATLHGISACGADIVLLDFWSPTCGPCMQMKPIVHSLIDARYPIRQVDVSREPELARQYGVTGIPCFVMLVDGQEVDRVVGATSTDRLVQMFDRGRIRTQSPEASTPQRPAEASIPWTSDNAAPVYANVAAGPAPRQPSAIASPPDEADWTREFDGKLLSCSVRLRVEDPQGKSHGSGTIIDAREGEALVITCGHIFRESKGEGPVTVELFEVGPQGARLVEKLAGQVVPGSVDLERDLALVSIRPSRPVCVAPVAPARTVVSRGDRAASVGCSNGQDPTIAPTRVTWLDRYQGPPNIEASGAPVEGRSGGGLFNDHGQLVGVCFAADYEGNKGLYSGLESIHGELARIGLGDISNGSTTEATPSGLADTRNQAEPSVVRGQEPLASSAAAPESVTITPTSAAETTPSEADAAVPQNLSATEQAAWEEIISRAATHEVVCIIRPKEPGGQSEIITLDDVSPEFVRALAARHKGSQAPVAK
jgi:thiol-disulfide isomerase/thioredoxin